MAEKNFGEIMAQNFSNLIKNITYRSKKIKKLGEDLYDLQLGNEFSDMISSTHS